jgi:hypothetical protein
MIDPGDCAHGRCRRLGVQRVPWKPHRIHLVLCELCGTTISTEQLRLRRQEARRA